MAASNNNDMGQQADQNEIESSELLHMSETVPVRPNEKKIDRQKNVLNSVGDLRSALASDVLTTQSPLETFISPFETPASTKTKSSGRYLEVPLVYCDQTASNRPVRSIEKYMEETCLPLYGNTHTNTSVTGSQSTAFVAEARQIVAEATNAKITGKASLDVVLFAGSGTTSAVELLVDCLGLQHAALEDGTNRPVVFVGPYEHHSNLLPWRESGCEIVMVPECEETQTVDIASLEKLLQSPKYANRFKMGTFSAASNVNGKVSDVDKISATLHRHGALAFFDYATGAPYMSINMNPTPSDAYPSASLVAKDAVFISPHKMIGGVGTPGVLILKKNLVQQLNPPHRSGGGTVFYVTNTHHRFLSNRIERYEGGTPNVAGILRAGLTFLFKRKSEEQYMLLHDRLAKNNESNSIPDNLLAHEFQTYKYVSSTLKKVAPNLVILGDDGATEGTHLPIFSFLIKCGKRFLHYNYVCAILNDVFGIQSRGGCQCSGPYSQRLLGLTMMDKDGMEVPNDLNQKIEHALINFKERSELLRPGYTRLSLPFKGLRQEEVEYVLKALEWVSKHGWKLMCQYRCNHRTGDWRHFSRQGKPLGRSERKWLSHYNMFASSSDETPGTTSNSVQEILGRALLNADALLDVVQNDQTNISQALKMNDAGGVLGSDDDGIESLRWYIYPKEVAKWLSENLSTVPGTDSNEMLGAVRPTAASLSGSLPSSSKNTPGQDVLVNANGLSNTNCKSTFQGPTEEALTSKLSPIGKKRKRPEIENGYSAPASLSRSDVNTTETKKIAPPSFYFKDGEHAGEAPFEDIEAGFDEGELSENCEVFDQEKDEWINISEFLRISKKVGGENTVGEKDTKNVSTSSINFRDGEHSGEASYEDIEAGFDDGELSEDCEIFDTKKDKWIKISDFLRVSKGVQSENVASMTSKDTPKPERMTTIKESTPTESKPTSGSNTSSFKDISNEKKKPQRDRSTWGQASFVPPKTMPALSNDAIHDQPQVTTKNETCTVTSDEAQKDQATSKKEKRKKKKGPGVKPPPKMMRMCTQAMIQWDMVEEGDRLLLGLSGGKDSLSLLHCLLEFQRKLPINFTIEVCTIDPMTPSFDPSPLIPYVESLGLKYHYIRDDIVARANSSGKDGKTVSSLCAFCARMKRGNLYTTARKNNCNKLVLAQHLDDCAESFLMSVMHNGFLRTMKAHYQINAGDISVIRPMVYCRESLMTEFAKSANLPVINENCPACFEEPKERARIKKLLSREETLYPNFYDNIRRSLIPLMHEDATAIMRGYTEETVSKSRKGNSKPRLDNKTKKRKKGGGDQGKSPVEYSTGNNNREPVKIESKPIEASIMIGDESKDKNPLYEASEDELLMELARRKAKRFRLAGSSARLETDDDPTGQVCSLNGGNGTIPCRELME